MKIKRYIAVDGLKHKDDLKKGNFTKPIREEFNNPETRCVILYRKPLGTPYLEVEVKIINAESRYSHERGQ